jgi:hypothetical protein
MQIVDSADMIFLTELRLQLKTPAASGVINLQLNRFTICYMTKPNEINLNRILFHVLSGIIQIIFFVMTHDRVVNFFRSRYDRTPRGGVGWGIAVQLTLYIFIALILLQHVFIYTSKNKSLLITICASVIFLLINPPLPGNYPYRAANITFVGILSFFMIFLFEYMSKLILKKKTTV